MNKPDSNEEPSAADKIARLTKREKEVLRLMAVDKLSNVEIAKRLLVSVNTVEQHQQNIRQKVLRER